MKEIENLIELKVNGKIAILVSDGYKGSPRIGYQYDILIGSKRTIDKYKEELIPRFYKKHKIQIKYIEE